MTPLPPFGLYAITPEYLHAAGRRAALLEAVSAAIEGGASLIQIRNKQASANDQLDEARALLAMCRPRGAALIINDSLTLAEAAGADGVHLGRDDGSIAIARARLGSEAIIGATCGMDLFRAEAAAAQGASYLAFGAIYPSATKPQAVVAGLAPLREARKATTLPICAIGGITPNRAPDVIAAGAHYLAAIDAVFGSAAAPRTPEQIHAAAAAFAACWPSMP